MLLATSRTKMSLALFVSFATRLLALLSNNTYRPLVETPTGHELSFPPRVPERSTLIKVVVPLVRSRRKTLRGAGLTARRRLLVPGPARLLAALANKTNRPSDVIMGPSES